MIKNFHSYLFTGEPQARRALTESLSQEFGISLKKSSPDSFIITPQKSSVGIDQIRQLKSHIFQKPLKSPYKLVIIEEAEKLTVEAQNALLKILEEPPSCAILVLEGANRQHLLPTIISRVAVRRAKAPKLPDKPNSKLMNLPLVQALGNVAQIESPKAWLDLQITILYQDLLENANRQKSTSLLVKTIKECAQTKDLIEANINPKFALFNLVFRLFSISK